MATATTKDDDLLIISEDDASSNSKDDIEFSFDFGEETSSSTSDVEKSHIAETQLSEEKIKETSQDVSEEIIQTETQISNSDLENTVKKTMTPDSNEKDVVDFSFDLGDSSGQESDISDSESIDSSNKEVAILDNTAWSSQDLEVSNESSMNDILSATIAKLLARQEVIATSKAWKATKEEDIKKQITELQSQVAELEVDMKSLDNESDKIAANIKELENMKLDPVKEHNSKRVTKK